jgi:hypothetical protein
MFLLLGFFILLQLKYWRVYVAWLPSSDILGVAATPQAF